MSLFKPRHLKFTLETCGRIAFWSALLVITIIATLPLDTPVGSSNDKVNHLLAFFFLYGSGRLANGQQNSTPLIIGLLGYGIGLEIVQSLLPFRYFSLADWLADAMGIALAKVAEQIIYRTKSIMAGG